MAASSRISEAFELGSLKHRLDTSDVDVRAAPVLPSAQQKGAAIF